MILEVLRKLNSLYRELGTRVCYLPIAIIRGLWRRKGGRTLCRPLFLQPPRELCRCDKLRLCLSGLLSRCRLLSRSGNRWLWSDDGSLGTSNSARMICAPGGSDNARVLENGRKFFIATTFRAGRLNHHVGKFFDHRTRVRRASWSTGDCGSDDCLASPHRGRDFLLPPFHGQGLFRL